MAGYQRNYPSSAELSLSKPTRLRYGWGGGGGGGSVLQFEHMTSAISPLVNHNISCSADSKPNPHFATVQLHFDEMSFRLLRGCTEPFW